MAETTGHRYKPGDARSLYSIDIIDSLHIAAVGPWGNEIQYEGGKNVYSSDAGINVGTES